jgi:hypothetical protein
VCNDSVHQRHTPRITQFGEAVPNWFTVQMKHAAVWHTYSHMLGGGEAGGVGGQAKVWLLVQSFHQRHTLRITQFGEAVPNWFTVQMKHAAVWHTYSHMLGGGEAGGVGGQAKVWLLVQGFVRMVFACMVY